MELQATIDTAARLQAGRRTPAVMSAVEASQTIPLNQSSGVRTGPTYASPKVSTTMHAWTLRRRNTTRLTGAKPARSPMVAGTPAVRHLSGRGDNQTRTITHPAVVAKTYAQRNAASGFITVINRRNTRAANPNTMIVQVRSQSGFLAGA
jgi:hypothetical protein